MEANPRPAIKHRPIVSRTPRATSSPPPPQPSSNRRYPLHYGDARAHSGLPMSHPSFARTTKFITSPSCINTLAAAGDRFLQNRNRRFSFNPDMETEEPTEKDEGRKEGKDNEIAAAKAKSETDPPPSQPPPPPPEKPEPGDCCGSGCVRCVWDVYYEELEDYNKLYGSDPNLGAS